MAEETGRTMTDKKNNDKIIHLIHVTEVKPVIHRSVVESMEKRGYISGGETQQLFDIIRFVDDRAFQTIGTRGLFLATLLGSILGSLITLIVRGH
jgi:hypothetical protein